MPLPVNAIPPRTSPLHPPPHPGVLPCCPLRVLRITNRPRGTHCCHMCTSASAHPSSVAVKTDGECPSWWSLLPDVPPAKYRKTRRPSHPLGVWRSSHMCVMHPKIITFRDPGFAEPSLRQMLLLLLRNCHMCTSASAHPSSVAVKRDGQCPSWWSLLTKGTYGATS